MDGFRKVLVWVCRDGAAPQRVHFFQSVTGHFGTTDLVRVSCQVERNRLVVSEDPTGVPLKRPTFCPIKHQSSTAAPLEAQQRGVDVGVAVILQSSNHRVLLTRRAKHLRIFPNLWVPPGGHLEPNETLVEAGLRELKEETGLDMEAEKFPSPKILGVWESVYPLMLSRGYPQRHHLVVYILLRSTRTHMQLQECLRPSPAEVSACLWADGRLVSAVVAAADGAADEPHGLPTSVSVSQVSPEGRLKDASLPVQVLMRHAPPTGPDVERVSSGTTFALDLWLKTIHSEDRL
ncbi:nucleoside diphosphate-linked moiety X motif 17 isoform X1 [Corythoichthys intestinalis]|uniref:nucleoside diphosphate-linked moiety X motif 17 isoform X1 n=1 Tax=Corythoichthys intestinalis TaxID=161448 RepID=UPI0025A640E1|nr:nucleoside diphosphate-linked moiety X motif 17 isoform X1 [Corythoichthys intestinalis]XP_057690379.1 nucleoside diphosphate-linked moiety X motif 17 isoform X1 [Corythoichthys intestinalis]